MKIFIFLFVLLVSCNSNDIVYERIENIETYKLKSTIINRSDSILSWPENIIIIDSLLIVSDYDVTDYNLHIFNKNSGEYIESFGREGKGPSEITSLRSVNYNYDKTSITVFDGGAKKIITYDVKNILQNKAPFYKEIKLNEFTYASSRFIKYKDKYLVNGYDEDLYFGIYDEGDVNYVYNNYSEIKNATVVPSIFNFEATVRVTPNQEKLVLTTYLGAILEIIDISKTPFTQSSINYIVEPKYDFAQGVKPPFAVATDETIYGFYDTCVTDEYIYTIFLGWDKTGYGKSYPEIIVFDWDGNPVHKYILDHQIESIAVDEDGVFYCAGLDKDENYVLLKLEKEE